MKTLYFDCISGICGDMTLAALIDLGVDKDLMIRELQKLNLSGWKIEFSEVAKQGIGAKHIEVILEEPDHSHDHTHAHSHHSPEKQSK